MKFSIRIRPLVLAILLFPQMLLAEECFYLVQQKALVEVTSGEQGAYRIPKPSVIEQCLTLDDVQRVSQMAEVLRKSQKISDEYEILNEKYRTLLDKNESTLDDFVNLTKKYDTQIESYQVLLGDHIDLTNRYDELAGGYRDVALNRASTFSIDLGAGSSTDGDVGAMVGLGWQRARVWSVLQEDQTIFMFGLSMPF